MAPNLSLSSASCQEKAMCVQLNRTKSPVPSVRLDCIVRHVFSHLVGPEFSIELLPLNSEEQTIYEAFKTVTKKFKAFSGDAMFELISSLNCSSDTADEAFLGVSNELFCEGITWGRIAAFTVFAGELSVLCLEKGLPRSVLHTICDCFLRVWRENLQQWILDHGGWEAFVEFSKDQEVKQETTPQAISPSWAKCAFQKTVRVLGALAYLANASDTIESVPVAKS